MSALGNAIGELFIKVRPDTSSFGDETKQGVDGALGGIQNASRAALAGVVAVGTGLYKVGAELDSAIDNLRTKTGATGTELASLEDSLKSVASNVPSTFDDVSTAIADTNRLLGLTGDELDARATQFLQLANVTGEDLGGAISSVTSLFNQFNIATSKQEGLLDNLYQASQASGLSVTALADAVNKSGAVLGQFGLSVEQSADLIALLTKNGVPATEMSRALTRVLQEAAAAGVPAGDALTFVSDAIKNAGSDAEAAGIALDVFGPKAGAKLAAQIRDGTLSLTDFSAALGASQDTIADAQTDTADFAETWQTLKNQLMIAFAPAAEQVFGAVGDAALAAAPALVMLAEAITPLITLVAGLPAPVLAAGLGLLAFGSIVNKLSPAVKTAQSSITGLLDRFKNLSPTMQSASAGLTVFASVALVGFTLQAKHAANATKEIAAGISNLSSVSDDQVVGTFVKALGDMVVHGQHAGDAVGYLASQNLEGAKRTLELGAAAGLTQPLLDDLAKAIDAEEAKRAQAAETMETYGAAADTTADAMSGLGDMTAEAAKQIDIAKVSMWSLTDAFSGLLNTLDTDDAYRGTLTALDRVKAAAEEAWIATSTGAANATELQRAYDQALADATRQVIDYGDRIGKLPPERATEILTLIDEGQYDLAAGKLAELEKVRQVRFDVVLNQAGKRLTITAGGGVQLLARGGIVDSATIMAGEAGREVVLPLTDPRRMAQIMRDSRVAGPMAAASQMMGGPPTTRLGGGSPVGVPEFRVNPVVFVPESPRLAELVTLATKMNVTLTEISDTLETGRTEPLTLMIEGEPFTAMLDERDRQWAGMVAAAGLM